MAKNRPESFVLGFWNYNNIKESGPDQVPIWKDLGLNVAMMPYYSSEKELEECLPPLLDELHKNGMKIVLSFGEIGGHTVTTQGPEALRAAFKKRYEQFGKHPAVLGFYPGEEPGDAAIDGFVTCIKIMLEEAPELIPFVDLGANDAHMDKVGMSGVPISGFGCYSQMEMEGGKPNDKGIDDFFRLMNNQIKACKKYGMDCMPTLLSSAHYRFRAPNEYDYTWQINASAACGCIGIYWFRLYDKLIALDYHGSPIDEYGEPGAHYNDMKRAQKRFNIHHGKIFMKLQHDESFFLVRRYGGYKDFPCEGYGTLARAYSPDTFFHYDEKAPLPAIIGYFNDPEDDSVEYIAVCNNTPFEPNSVMLEFKPEIKKVEYIFHNGDVVKGLTQDGPDIRGYDHIKEEIWLAPGQMELLRVYKK